jgi:hexosaminidase
MTTQDLRLDLEFWPATGTEALRYQFTLTNTSDTPLTGFALAWSGHGRIDRETPIENATLQRSISNYNEIAPPPGFVLAPGASWPFVVRATPKPIRHWTDAASAAFLITADGKTLPVAVGICNFGPNPGEPILGLDFQNADGPIDQGIAVIPRPRIASVSGTQHVETLTPTAATPEGEAAIAAFAALTTLLFPTETLLAPAGLAVRLHAADLPPEQYRLRFEPGAVHLEAASHSGFLYGLITLGQMLRAATAAPDRARIPATGTIEDAPEYDWRGTHLDVARQFYDITELHRLLAIMAWNKMNRFHLHLTEDEAWRWEVSAYPELVAQGAYRGHGLALPPLLGSGAEPYGGSYSKAELRALVTFATSLNIEIMPEIDVPGHCYAAVQALSWLRDPGENGEYRSTQGFPNNCLSPAVPRTAAFIDTLFQELMELFPGRYIHVGGDEVPDDAWSSSPLARARLDELGGAGASALQADFLSRLHTSLTAAGRITGAWEEGADAGGISPESSLMFAWRDTEIGGRLAAEGYDVVMTPGQAYYLDMALSPDWWEPGAAWAGWSSVEHTYRYDPTTGFDPAHRARLRGVQCCIWSEPMRDRRVFERLVFPRLSAIAETGWTTPSRKSWKNFSAIAPFLPTLYG